VQRRVNSGQRTALYKKKRRVLSPQSGVCRDKNMGKCRGKKSWIFVKWQER